MDTKYVPLIAMIFSMVGMSIGLLIFHKLLKNPFRYIANTRKKKLISIAVLILLYVLIGGIFDSSNIYFKDIYKWTIFGVLLSISNRVFRTEKEDKKINIDEVE